MKNKEYLLTRLVKAVSAYETSDESIEQIEAFVEMNVLTDILEPEEIPLHLHVGMYTLLMRMFVNEWESLLKECDTLDGLPSKEKPTAAELFPSFPF